MRAASTNDLISQVVESYVRGRIPFEIFEAAIGFLVGCQSEESYPWCRDAA